MDSKFPGVCVFVLRFSLFFFFFFFGSARICWLLHSKQCICALFTDLQIPLFSNFFIKNESHSTIYTFKNYFATVFSISVFSFSKNKLNLNGPLVLSSGGFVLHQCMKSHLIKVLGRVEIWLHILNKHNSFCLVNLVILRTSDCFKF